MLIDIKSTLYHIYIFILFHLATHQEMHDLESKFDESRIKANEMGNFAFVFFLVRVIYFTDENFMQIITSFLSDNKLTFHS